MNQRRRRHAVLPTSRPVILPVDYLCLTCGARHPSAGPITVGHVYCVYCLFSRGERVRCSEVPPLTPTPTEPRSTGGLDE
jgi:hypothetical protein